MVICLWTYKGSVKSCRQEPSAPSPFSSVSASCHLRRPAPFWLGRWIEKWRGWSAIFKEEQKNEETLSDLSFPGNFFNVICPQQDMDKMLLNKRTAMHSLIEKSGYEGWIEGLCDGYKN